MNITWYWWGFRVYVDDAIVHEFITAAQQGRTAIESFLRRKATQLGLWWLGPAAPLVSPAIADAVNDWGVASLQAADSNCGHRGCSYTIPWTVWSSYPACR